MTTENQAPEGAPAPSAEPAACTGVELPEDLADEMGAAIAARYQLDELMRGLEICPELRDCTPLAFYELGRRIREQEKAAAQSPAEAHGAERDPNSIFQTDGLPERDPSKPAEQQGLFRKFNVTRTDGSDKPGGKHENCEYFVLDVGHDKHAPAALWAYAQACKDTHPDLAADLVERYDLDVYQPQPKGTADQPPYWRNLLESCANWLDTRSRCQVLHIQPDPEEGGGYASLMRIYAENLRELNAILAAGQAPAPAPQPCKGDTGECSYNGACMYACGQAPAVVVDGTNPPAGPLDYMVPRVAAALKAAIKDRGVTQVELARRLECTEAEVSDRLSGRRNLTLSSMSEMCDLTGLRMDVRFYAPSKEGDHV